MTDEKLREFMTVCALGMILEDHGITAEDVVTPDELERIQGLADEVGALSDDDADELSVATAKTLLRESIDRLLAVDAATTVEPEETLETVVAE